MKKKLTVLGGILSTLMLVASACGSDEPDQASDATEFNRLIHSGVSFDYQPLESAKDAKERADSIVVVDLSGAMTTAVARLPNIEAPPCDEQAKDAIEITEADGDCADYDPSEVGRFVGLEGTVVDVLHGDAVAKGETFTVLVDIAPITPLDELEKNAPTGKAVLLLAHDPNFPGFEGATLEWADGRTVDASQPMLIPFVDGLWFQTEEGTAGPWVDSHELPSGWNHPHSVDEIVDELAKA